jgi:ketosteroid isomerase-like protein
VGVARDLTQVVRDLWAAFGRGGIEATLDEADDGVEWLPSAADGRVLRGHEELRDWARSLRTEGRTLTAHVYAIEERGETVLVAGHLRVDDGAAIADRQMHWLYLFEDGRLRRAESFTTREEALAARDRRAA